jgi:hypothetical protein
MSRPYATPDREEITAPELIEFKAVTCPWCFEPGELAIEADLEGELVVDCEVCCRPWRVLVRRRGGFSEVDVDRSD